MMLAAPLVAANISRTVMSFVDFAMVSQIGREAQAAIVPAGLVLWTVTAFGIGLMSLVSTCVSQSLGRRRRATCGAYAWQGFYLSIILGLAVLPLIGPAVWMFRNAPHAEAVKAMEIAYTRISLFGMGPATACVALVGFFSGVHRSGIGFFSALVANLFNIVGNYVLIFGHFGFPAMGIAGAAWATLAATFLQMAILLFWLLRRRYRDGFATHRTLAPRWHLMRDILVRGVPVGFQFCCDIGAWTVFTIYFVGMFGEASLAANGICFKILEVSFMPASGLGQALTAAFGKAFGAGDHATARRYVRWCLVIMAAYMGTVGLVMAVFRVELPSLFSHDPEVIGIAASLMIMGAMFQVFDALQMTYAGALRGAGDTTWPAVAVVVCLVVILLGGGWAMAAWRPAWGAVGVWAAATAYIAVIGCVLLGRYRYGRWAELKAIGS